ncbi:hypothetical protein [Mycobacterium paragordonae]|uniref:MarR family transcriptional regulator n=1 Tax=Mycobacterium paragordonae TaxID=1389713 RepID=A0ABQ1CFW4_9MYCO|nr:hypothetical protein [Mycobacterium paragordonae]GFG83252.1 hypothetical protein MPRG_65280 [Mycobacterium paragordonae]
MRDRVVSLSTELEGQHERAQVLAERCAEQQRLLDIKDAEIGRLHNQLADLEGLRHQLRKVAEWLAGAADKVAAARDLIASTPSPLAEEPPVVLQNINDDSEQRETSVHQPDSRSGSATVSAVAARDGQELKFRAGAQRMLESLGRMAPLRLSRAQWGMVARMKHRSGTWSTYLGELRRAGLLDENAAGFTLSDKGFDYLGGRPDPLTGRELQQHYLHILRSGAARMLQAVMDVYPESLSRQEISARAGIVVASGTFTTYLGELVRNGLVVYRGKALRASDVLMLGAERAVE